ncbi:MAG: carbamoyltransferase HypF [Lysobacterales bacterium]|jgi:hydrogenase maturation protein HypF
MTRRARKIVVTGRVQGVGYRPFVYVTAQALGLKGSVLNGSGKVFIHAEGTPESLERLETALVESAPPLARPELSSSEAAEWSGATAFEILASDAATEPEIHVPPDMFTCDDCLAELTGPQERRFGYPFINCTQCGPRYTIIKAMPYDRPNTSMADFPLCDACRAEYESPVDRRFHAQPLACPECGPKLEFVNTVGARSAGPLQQAVAAIEAGQVVAIKGVGGYHLVCDAASDAAVARLRDRKRRPHKPLAVMFPLAGGDGLDALRAQLDLDEVAAAAVADPARPIVLIRKGAGYGLSAGLAPGLDELGAFLPYSPLHHQLLASLGRPIVATSGNISGEPVITDNAEAQQRLSGVADAFLHHDRPIVRPADDPVLRPMAGAPRAIRLGRGIAPLEWPLGGSLSRPLVATGGHMKVTVALAWGERAVVSPHVGDLDSPRSNDVFNQVINDLQRLYDVKPEMIVCDLHPGYASTRWARRQDLPMLQVQHHAAHASALAGEHPDVERWLVFTWDGVGYGSDGSLWGGEALAGSPGAWRRTASFRPFRLVGGDKAGREPWRSAAALLWAEAREFRISEGAPGDDRPESGLLRVAHDGWRKNINAFETSAVGRLFDAAAALVLDRNIASFEGQGPMELEHIAADGCPPVPLRLLEDGQGVLRADWAPLVDMLTDRDRPAPERAGVFHESMAQSLLVQVSKIRERTPFDAVGLSGGVFQNRRLTERVVDLATAAGIDVRLHCAVPANDGGLSFGQVIEAMHL